MHLDFNMHRDVVSRPWPWSMVLTKKSGHFKDLLIDNSDLIIGNTITVKL